MAVTEVKVSRTCDACGGEAAFPVEIQAHGYSWVGIHDLCHDHTLSLLKFLASRIDSHLLIRLVGDWQEKQELHKIKMEQDPFYRRMHE